MGRRRRRSSTRKGKQTNKCSMRKKKLPPPTMAPDEFKVLLAKQEVRIKELEGQVAEAAKTAEAADALRGVIEQVKARAADERAE